jgi:hypothetical protein
VVVAEAAALAVEVAMTVKAVEAAASVNSVAVDAAAAMAEVEAAEAVAEPNWTYHSFNADEAYVKPQESSFFVFLSTQ